jgi:hypothetical protein
MLKTPCAGMLNHRSIGEHARQKVILGIRKVMIRQVERLDTEKTCKFLQGLLAHSQ